MKKEFAIYFEAHQAVKSFFFTSDGQAFYEWANANSHAQNLKQRSQDNTVTEVTREQYEEWREGNVKNVGNAGGELPAADPAPESDTVGDVIIKSAQQQLDEAQAAYDKAAADNNTEDMVTTKKALTVAKGRVTRESKSAA